jgi:hypothetical protein
MESFSHIPESEKKQKWFLLITPLVSARCASSVLQESNLLKAMQKESGFNSWKTIKKAIEFVLVHAERGDSIFSRSAQIRTSPTPDGVIDDMFAEVRAVPYLVQKGFYDIEYNRRDGLDFSAIFDEKTYHVEVAYLSGPSFKTQTQLVFKDETIINPVYQLEAKKLVNRLKTICTAKEKQAIKHGGDPSNTIILLVSDLEEMHQPWLEHDEFQGQHPILGLITSRKFPTVILAPNTVYEPPASALEGMFGKMQSFDWKAFEKWIPRDTAEEHRNV